MTDQVFEARLARDMVALADDEIQPYDVRGIAERAVSTRGDRGRELLPPRRRQWLMTLMAAALLLVILLASTLILGSRPAIVPAPQGFPELVLESTGPMARARSGHAAVLLPDGRVLVTGGWDGHPVPDEPADCGVGCDRMNHTPEAYDPTTGTFTPTSTAMVVTRQDHTMTAMSDGKVLIVGGQDAAGNMLGSESYHPDTDTFTPLASPTVSRGQHIAVTLLDERILLLGGIADASGSPRTGVPETYDPATGGWTAGGDSDLLVDTAAATVLRSGSVLVLASVVSVFPDGPDSSGFALHEPRSGMSRVLRATTGRSSDSELFGTVRGSSLRADGWVLFTLRDERNRGAWPGDDSGLYAIEPVTGVVELVTKDIGRPTHGPVAISDGRVIVLTDPAEGGPIAAWVVDPTTAEHQSLGEVPRIGTGNGLPGLTLTALAGDSLLITGGNDGGGVTTAAASLIHPGTGRP